MSHTTDASIANGYFAHSGGAVLWLWLGVRCLCSALRCAAVFAFTYVCMSAYVECSCRLFASDAFVTAVGNYFYTKRCEVYATNTFLLFYLISFLYKLYRNACTHMHICTLYILYRHTYVCTCAYAVLWLLSRADNADGKTVAVVRLELTAFLAKITKNCSK